MKRGLNIFAIATIKLRSITTPTVTVQGAFTGGGNNEGTIHDAQDHYELQNYTTAALGSTRHPLRRAGCGRCATPTTQPRASTETTLMRRSIAMRPGSHRSTR